MNVKQVVLAFAVEFWIIGLIIVGTYLLIAGGGNLSGESIFSALLFPAALSMGELARVPLAGERNQMAIVRYARVSTQGQHLSGRLEVLKIAGARRVYQEKISGVRADRPQLAKLMASLRKDDIVLVTKLDRLGRSARKLLDLMRRIDKAGAAFQRGQVRMQNVGREMIGLRKNGTTFPIELTVSEMAVRGRRMFVAAMRDITRRKRNAERQKMLMGELDHRVKNVLARVAMLAASTRKGSTSIDEYIRSLNGRIQSMATAHRLLSESGWQNVQLGALVHNQLAPYATDSNVTIKGEDIMLGAAEIQALAMVLHELVTNAAKYGSLSAPDGQISVTWDIRELNEGVKLVLQWQEVGGPTVTAKGPSGYGSNLIRDLIPHELEGMVDLVFAPGGVSCKIEIPLESTWITTRGLTHTMS